jgi:hypothetical protein
VINSRKRCEKVANLRTKIAKNLCETIRQIRDEISVSTAGIVLTWTWSVLYTGRGVHRVHRALYKYNNSPRTVREDPARKNEGAT